MLKLNNWERFLSTERIRPSTTSPNDSRSEFEKDYGRMVFSSVVRRLQGKSQVFPLDPNDFVRTRLTHSMEVATLGRSVGSGLEKIVGDETTGLIGPILATAGLVHDIGNPPFGHHGETAIQEFFGEYFQDDKNSDVVGKLTDEQKQDFLHFDGNPQTFRLLTRLQWLWDNNGFNLTAATLATTVKYPVMSTDINNSINGNKYKKLGFFQSEKSIFDYVQKKCGLEYGRRHPLAYVLEALDDIAYLAADIEDGVKKGLITLDDLKEAMGDTYYNHASRLVSFPIPKDLKAEEAEILVQRLRIWCQGEMIKVLLENFKDNFDALTSGQFQGELLKFGRMSEWVENLKNLAKDRLFKAQSVLRLEVAGTSVIKGLLEIFIRAITNSKADEMKSTDNKILALIPPRLHYVSNKSVVDRFQMVVDFVSGMTDDYAVQLYQQLSGVSL